MIKVFKKTVAVLLVAVFVLCGVGAGTTWAGSLRDGRRPAPQGRNESFRDGDRGRGAIHYRAPARPDMRFRERDRGRWHERRYHRGGDNDALFALGFLVGGIVGANSAGY